MKDRSGAVPCSIAVTGGKGGVGKTSIALNVALSLAAAGRQVMLVDADLGLGNVDILLGLEPARNLGHVLRGECAIEDVVLEGPYGLRVVPAASGVAAMASLSRREQDGLVTLVQEMAEGQDFLIVDTAAGISPHVTAFSAAVQHILLVLLNEPAALTDAYGLVKVLARDHGRRRFETVSNQVRRPQSGQALYEHFCTATDRFLGVALGYLGEIPSDPALRRAAQTRKPLIDSMPRSPAALAIEALAQALLTRLPRGGEGAFSEQSVAGESAG